MRVLRMSTGSIAFFVLFSVGCSNGTTKQKTTSARTKQKNMRTAAWHEVSAENGQFKVKMPTVAVPVQIPMKRTINGKNGSDQHFVYKAQSGGVFFNLWVRSYPKNVIESYGGGITSLQKISTILMRKKKGHQQEYLTHIKDAKHPAIEHRYYYPIGTNSDGIRYAAGYAIHRVYLVGNQICWVFVDVVDSYAESNADKVESEIKRFFDSLVIAGSSQTSE